MLSTRWAPMSRWRTRGSNGDSHSSISDLSSGVVLKLLVMLKALLILLKACDIFSIFAAWDAVEREVLIDLGFVKAVL